MERSGTVGPLFWAHYSYLGLDPHGLSDSYANYWDVVTHHTDIVFGHCVDNPNGFGEYGENCWGLTAGYTRNPDGSTGYAAHQPNNDNGVITPTAALSSMPYAPARSMDFLRYLYEDADGQYLGADAQYVGALGPFDAILAPLRLDDAPLPRHRSGHHWADDRKPQDQLVLGPVHGRPGGQAGADPPRLRLHRARPEQHVRCDRLSGAGLLRTRHRMGPGHVRLCGRQPRRHQPRCLCQRQRPALGAFRVRAVFRLTMARCDWCATLDFN